MGPYVQDIMKLLRCSESEAHMIEHIMREQIFHSTLDGQTQAEFNRGARKAARLLAADREPYEGLFRAVREASQRTRAERTATELAIIYEI